MHYAATRFILFAVSVATLVTVSIVGQADAGRSSRDKIAPSAPTNVHVVKATPFAVYVAWDTPSASEGVAGYFVYGDSGKAVVSNPAYIVSRLGCGESSALSVAAFDRSGNRSPRTTALIATAACPDTRPPSTPSGFKQLATTRTAVVLTWNPSVDNVGVVGYGVFRGASKIADVAEPSITVNGLTCDTTYSYLVDAVDAAGNRSRLGTAYMRTASCADSTPPSAPSGLAVTGKSSTSLTASWKASTDDVGVAGYRLVVDGAPKMSVTQTSATLTGLTCGKSYTLAVDAFDTSGNRSASTSTFGATSACAAPPTPPTPPSDTEDPTTPGNLTVSDVTQTAMKLGWSASRDNVGVTGYDVYRNSAKVASTTSTTAQMSGLSCGTTYQYEVVARDAAGNASEPARVSAATGSCSAPPSSPPPTPPSDTEDPTTPGNLTVSDVTQTAMKLGWSASRDNVGVTGYDVYRNSAKVASTTSTTAQMSGLSCGTTYQYEVVARDAAGNASEPARVSAATAPCSAPPAPPADTTPPSQPTGLAASNTTRTSIALSWAASTDNVAVTGYRVLVNGSVSGTTPQPGYTVSNLTCGTSYTLAVEAYDAAGNRSARASATASTAACADTQAPSAPTGLAATSRTATSIALAWNPSTDNVGVTGYGLFRNGTSAGTTSTPSGIFSGLACNTNYTLAVEARDAAGNRSAQTVVMVSTTACPDTTPPSTPTGLAASNVTQSGLSLSWNQATDNVGVAGYDVYRNGTKMTTVTGTSAPQSGLACGTSYTFGVVARDAAGNQSAPGSLTAQTAACAAPPPPPPSAPPPSSSWSGPITITQGGTYSGSWESTSSTPAVKVATTQPVTITGRVRNLAGGTLIQATSGAQVTVDHVFAYGGDSWQTSGRFFDAENFKSVTIRNCTIENTRGIELTYGESGSTVLITRNKHHNIQGNGTDPVGNFVQFRVVQNSTIEVSWNEIVNEYNKSNPEDVISLYHSSNAWIHDNYIQGHFRPGNGPGSSQNTITLDGYGGSGQPVSNNRIEGNILVRTLSIAVFPTSTGPASNNVFANNRVVNAGYLDDGVTRNYYGYQGMHVLAGGSGNHAHGNTLGTMRGTSQGSYARGNDGAFEGAPEGDSGEWANNTRLKPGQAITRADEDAERQRWNDKVAAAGVSLGA